MYSIAREIKYDGGETGVFEFLWISIRSFANWLMRFALKYNVSFCEFISLKIPSISFSLSGGISEKTRLSSEKSDAVS